MLYTTIKTLLAVMFAASLGWLSSTEFEDMRRDNETEEISQHPDSCTCGYCEEGRYHQFGNGNFYWVEINDSAGTMYLTLIDNLTGRKVANLTNDTILSNIINKDNE